MSMTDLVSTEDDLNLQVSTGLSAAIDEGRRRRRLSQRALDLRIERVSAEVDVNLRVSMGLSAAIDEGCRR